MFLFGLIAYLAGVSSLSPSIPSNMLHSVSGLFRLLGRLIGGEKWNANFLRQGRKYSGLRIRDSGSCPSSPTMQTSDPGYFTISFQTLESVKCRVRIWLQNFCRLIDSWDLPKQIRISRNEAGHFYLRQSSQLILFFSANLLHFETPVA